jgi:hypothetical protein
MFLLLLMVLLPLAAAGLSVVNDLCFPFPFNAAFGWGLAFFFDAAFDWGLPFFFDFDAAFLLDCDSPALFFFMWCLCFYMQPVPVMLRL